MMNVFSVVKDICKMEFVVYATDEDKIVMVTTCGFFTIAYPGSLPH